MSGKNSAITGVSLILLQGAVNASAGLATFLYTINKLSVPEVGVLGVLMIFSSTFGVVGTFGFEMGNSRFIAFFNGRNQQDAARAFASKTIFLSLTFSLILAIPHYIILNFILSNWADISEVNFLVILNILYAITSSLVLTSGGILQGNQRYRRQTLAYIISQLARLPITVILLSMGFGLVSVLLGWVVFNLLFIIITISSRSLTGRDQNFNEINYRYVINNSKYFAMFASIITISGIVDSYVLLAFVNSTEYGAYQFSIMLASNITIILEAAVLGGIMPSLSRRLGSENSIANDVSELLIRYGALILVPFIVSLIVLSPSIINIFGFGKYDNFVSLLNIAFFAYGIRLIGSIFVSNLSASNNGKQIMYAYAIGLGAGVVVTFLLAPMYNITGGIIGKTINYLSVMLLCFFFLLRSRKLSYSNLVDLRHTVLITASVAIPILLLNYSIGINLVTFLISITLFVTIMAAYIRITFCIKREDLEYITNVMPKGYILKRILRI